MLLLSMIWDHTKKKLEKFLALGVVRKVNHHQHRCVLRDFSNWIQNVNIGMSANVACVNISFVHER